MADGNFGGGTGELNNPYLIEDAFDLDAVRNDRLAHYKLVNNIDLNIPPFNEGEGWEPLGYGVSQWFRGTFDGDGYTVNGLYINHSNKQSTNNCNVGLFNSLGSAPNRAYMASIKNLKVFNVNIFGNEKPTGGLVGHAHSNYSYEGIIENCSVVLGKISGKGYVGGLIGSLEQVSYVYNCYSLGVHITASSSNTVIGDFVGLFSAYRESDLLLKNCYSMNHSKNNIFFGLYNKGYVSNCFWRNAKNIKASYNGIESLTIQEFMSDSVFKKSVWNNDRKKPWKFNNGSPKLWYEQPLNNDIRLSPINFNKEDYEYINIKLPNNTIRYSVIINNEFYEYSELVNLNELKIPAEILTEKINDIGILISDNNYNYNYMLYTITLETEDNNVYIRNLNDISIYEKDENIATELYSGIIKTNDNIGTIKLPVEVGKSSQIKSLLIEENKQLEPIIPEMNGYEEDGYVIHPITGSVNNYYEWQALNSFDDAYWMSEINNETITSFVIEMPEIKTITHYMVGSAIDNIRTYVLPNITIEGSIDNQNWFLIDKQENMPHFFNYKMIKLNQTYHAKYIKIIINSRISSWNYLYYFNIYKERSDVKSVEEKSIIMDNIGNNIYKKPIKSILNKNISISAREE